MPDGTGAVGIGVILIGLNLARSWKGQPINRFTNTFGILALLMGGLELAGPYLHLTFELPIFAILLLVLGLILLGSALKERKIMDRTLQRYSLAEGRSKRVYLVSEIAWGSLGGLAGTLVMDLLLMGALLVLEQPATLCFSIVGDTVSRFFAMLGTQVAGGVSTGVVTHYVVGPLFGILFGAVITRLPILRGGSLKKITIAALVYVEILSQPILVTTPILLKMKTPATLQWYGGAFIMHLMMSIVLGLTVGYGLQPAPQATPRRSR